MANKGKMGGKRIMSEDTCAELEGEATVEYDHMFKTYTAFT